ncbi:di/tricarboxylate transporter [Orenia metallireducens]|uniref:Di- and tricarboxylate transporter n=1 Tax=Orenia metallireducens TaxID=1413210 RepID=A0A285IHQ5_9FIRM|nr:SLC13 family permease [Orenia metallireducens]PRX17466.1 di/tricarboxylate transporter [Orenia metallireducens]SNY47530.1 Di- and tricarboxylate transporter [Orenia metallireducens]
MNKLKDNLNIKQFWSTLFISLIIFSLAQLPEQSAYAKAINDVQVKAGSGINSGMVVVSALVLVFVVLSLWEPLRLDILALSIPVILIIFKGWTKVTATEVLSGFANKATITVLAMFILSEGVKNSGLVQILGDKIAKLTSGEESKQLAVIMGLSGVVAGIINNTPVVATFIPMVTNLARKTKTSPSKLLIPLSYASMMGGMMTLLGTSTNLLASDISARLIGYRFSMFEFTKLGFIILIVGFLYLFFIGRHLIPKRIDTEDDLITEYQMEDFLTQVVIQDNSPLINQNIGETLDKLDFDINVVQIVRDGEKFIEPIKEKELKVGDNLIVRSNHATLLKIIKAEGLKLLPEVKVNDKYFEEPIKGQKLLEVVVPHASFLVGQTLEEVNFLERYNTTVLAIRRGSKLSHQKMDDLVIEPGDVLLLIANDNTIDRLQKNSNFIITKELDTEDYNTNKIPTVLTIIISVVLLAAFNILPIAISALAGVIAMVVTKAVNQNKIYEVINWEVIFLLAGLIPLGIAIEKTGTASYIADKLLIYSNLFPPTVTLILFYLLTSILTNIISNNASVVLMLPVAVNAANRLGLNPFAFILAVTFAASTAFMTPLGYQTNLMVYGPGGYKFRDYMIVGAPLQILLAIVTSLGIVLFWGI